MQTSNLKHLLSVLLLFVTLTASASDFKGSAPADGESYYIYNVGTGMFLSEGDNWGTHASVNVTGSPLKLVKNDDGFTVRTQFGSNNMSHVDGNIWMDQTTATKWLFTLVDTAANKYAIGVGTTDGYLKCARNQSKVTVGKLSTLAATAKYVHWILVPIAELNSRMNNATYSTPVEATHLIPNSRFDIFYNGTETWSGTEVTIGGYRADATGITGGNHVAYVQDKSFNSYYEISGKAGIYKLAAQGNHYSKADNKSIAAQFYIGESYATLPIATVGNLSTTAKSIAQGSYKTEELMFSSSDSKIKIGFRKEEANTGDLTMIDNLRLYYYGNALADHQAFLIELQNTANELKDVKTATSVAEELNTQIAAFSTTDTTTIENCVSFAQKVIKAISDAKYSAQVFEKLNNEIEAAEKTDSIATDGRTVLLKEAIDNAKTVYNNADTDTPATEAMKALQAAVENYKYAAKMFPLLKNELDEANKLIAEGGNGVDSLQKAVTAAQTVYDNMTASGEEAEAATANLKQAMTDYNFANASGEAPTVVTDPRFARGGTMAFGRMSVSGMAANQIIEQGFCYATHDNPTYDDNRTTDYLNSNGKIYCIKNLTPGTVYYMRAYALSNTYAIGYGDVIKVITIPKANVNYYLDGADGWNQEARNRISAGAEYAKQLWNDLTSINGYTSRIGQHDGVPTAECSYGGWMTIGGNGSYQRTGTILHEWLHGIGVGTHWTWWSTDLHPGAWVGDRATEVLRFWNNNTTEMMSGDSMHMWPYGVNGAHEDNGSNELYYGLSLICQAMCEDGLIPTNGFCLPAYTLPVDNDDTKYYIKSESKNHGFYDSFLFVESNGSLKWKQVKQENVNDSCAWTITFTPNNAYYQLRNVATGRYITYSNNAFTTAERNQPLASDNLHIMRGRIDVAEVEGLRGYWLIHPEHTDRPATMTATANGKVTTSAYNLSNTAVAQRWMIATMDEHIAMEEGIMKIAMDELNAAIANVSSLLATPHTETVADADNTFTTILSDIETKAAACTTSDDVRALIPEVYEAEFNFLLSVKVTDIEQPFDLTYKIVSPRMDKTDGWDKTNGGDPGLSFSCAEFYVRTFDFNQTITDLPQGTYQMAVQGFQRPGEASVVYKDFSSGKNNVTTSVYAGTAVQPIKNAMEGASDKNIGGAESTVGSQFIPNNMEAASIYFKAGRYENKVTTELTAEKNNLKIGVKCSSAPDWYWTIFDDFRLYFFGGMTTEEVGIDNVTNSATLVGTQYFSLNGTVLNAPQKGINILRQTYSDGKVTVKKVFVK